ncbi:DUF3298 and DUF4163 domain-containing protein [Paenibacillus aurantius]|uniref:DUF3298 and DUF4163 domain-containing protein n=1 Tax=Paenibacillus aurantius TaxID=2918900 RepID=A0AA96LAV3_9BACL|nr:DUF3298 and DUF4163 domain-containing protein [Paenibacillus aurantius]WNQ08975.1 DUF3298 and DUF4163 domain-containing protein [Paenibacillus aurantius]
MSLILYPVKVISHRLTGRKLNVVYPVVESLPHPEVQRKINEAILTEVRAMLRAQDYPANPDTEVTGYYEIKTNERGVLSLSLFSYAYSGGAHGITLQRSLTFAIQTGEKYSLKDLFKPETDYIRIVNRQIEEQIMARQIPLLEEFKTIRPDQDFYIADKALVVYFQLYELTAYVYGFTYFPLSVYSLQPYIREDGPLGTMIY